MVGREGTSDGGAGHLGFKHTETQRGRLWTACGQRRVDSKNSQTTPATTSTSSIRQLLGAGDAQTAHPATSSPAVAHQPLGSANAQTTPAAAADRTQRPDGMSHGGGGVDSPTSYPKVVAAGDHCNSMLEPCFRPFLVPKPRTLRLPRPPSHSSLLKHSPGVVRTLCTTACCPKEREEGWVGEAGGGRDAFEGKPQRWPGGG